MPNILLCFTNNLSLENWNSSGGLSRELRYLKKFINNNYSFVLLTYGYSKDEDIKLPKSINIIPMYKVLGRIRNKYINNLFHLIRLIKVSKILKNIDIIKSNQLIGSNISILIGILFRKKVIVRIGYEPYLMLSQDKYLPSEAQNKAFNNFFFIRLYILGFFSYQLCDHIICTSKVQKDFISEHYFINKNKISVIPNWIDTNLFRPEENDIKKTGILFVGRLDSSKNPELLLNSMSGIDEKITFVGEGKLKNKLLKIANKMNLDIEVIDPIPNECLVKFYNKCKIFVQTSYFEGNPKTILEAMSCGCAVIAKNVLGTNEVINKNNGILINKDSDLNLALKNLLGDKTRRKKLGINARKSIIINNDINLCLKKEKYIYSCLHN